MFTSLLIKTQHLRIIWKIKGLSTLDAYALRHGHSTIFPHAVKYVKNASLSTLDPVAGSVSTRFFCF